MSEMSPEGPDLQLTDPWLAADVLLRGEPREDDEEEDEEKDDEDDNDEDGDDGYSE